MSELENANYVNVTGTGLGLFVAREMAQAMGVTSTLPSKGEGKGSTFTFRDACTDVNMKLTGITIGKSSYHQGYPLKVM
ncbi:MAG: hypothetical protein R3B69_00980 [Candidatus Paceibacterota bacterium]